MEGSPPGGCREQHLPQEEGGGEGGGGAEGQREGEGRGREERQGV